MSFTQALTTRSHATHSRVCVGLDPDPSRLPDQFNGRPDRVVEFLKVIVDATHDLACAYKPNLAFFGSLGLDGLSILRSVRDKVPVDVPVILDFKAGDIGNTADRYAAMAYDVIGADAVTVNPYMGLDAVKPFLRRNRCAFALCLTSNDSASQFQRLPADGQPLFQHIASVVSSWSHHGECGLVVGATQADDLSRIRELAPTLPILVPGVGAQGGDAEAVVRNGSDADGGGLLINASRSILYASSGDDYADKARETTEALRKATWL